MSNRLKEFVAFMILNYSSGANRFFVFDWTGAILQQAFTECLAKGARLQYEWSGINGRQRVEGSMSFSTFHFSLVIFHLLVTNTFLVQNDER